MILLLGGSGYIGTAFQRFFQSKSIEYRSVSRIEVDYTDRDQLVELLKQTHASFLINAAGYTGKPNVDACELHKVECLLGNAVLPGIVREACEITNTYWGHVSSGCIYTGQRFGGGGFTELDKPNFCFQSEQCSFYSGTKALGEKSLEGCQNVYIWRLRIPFNNIDSPTNYLSKLQRYDRLLDARNSITQLDEFVRVCWESWQRRIPTGIYNITNTGSITTREVVELIKQHLKLDKQFQYFENEAEFMQLAATTPRSNCTLDNSKLLNTGIQISEVHEAVERSLREWRVMRC